MNRTVLTHSKSHRDYRIPPMSTPVVSAKPTAHFWTIPYCWISCSVPSMQTYLESDLHLSTDKAQEVIDSITGDINGILQYLKRVFLIDNVVESVKFAARKCFRLTFPPVSRS